MNNLEIRNHNEKCAIVFGNWQRAKSLPFLFLRHLKWNWQKRKKRKRNPFKNCNCDEHLFINALRYELKIYRFGCER